MRERRRRSSRSARRSARPTAARGARSTPLRFPPTKLIQIDIDPQEIGKIYPVDVGIVGDAKTVLRQLVDALRGWTPNADDGQRRVDDARSPSHRAGTPNSRRPSATRQADSSGAPARRDREGRAARCDLRDGRRLEQERRRTAAAIRTCRRPSSPAARWRRWDLRPPRRSARRSARPDRTVICLVGDGGFLSVVRSADDRRRAGHPGGVGDLQQFLLLDDSHRRHDVLQERLRHGVHARPTASPTTPISRCWRKAFGIESARVESPDDLARRLDDRVATRTCRICSKCVTRGDVPMPRTGYWDIADFLAHGND